MQLTWWNLFGYDGSGNDNGLTAEALNFEEYITNEKIAGGESETVTINGTKFHGFPINYDPKFSNTKKIDTVFSEETQKWIIGPFKIDYLEREHFSEITNIYIYTDADTKPLDKSKYKLARKKEDSGSTMKLEEYKKNEFPKDSEEFYIELDYDKDIHSIYDIQVDFSYQNAGGYYNVYDANYHTVHTQGTIVAEYSTEAKKAMDDSFDKMKNLFEDGKGCMFFEGSTFYPGDNTFQWVDDLLENLGLEKLGDLYNDAKRDSATSKIQSVLSKALEAGEPVRDHANFYDYMTLPSTNYYYDSDNKWIVKDEFGVQNVIWNPGCKGTCETARDTYKSYEDAYDQAVTDYNTAVDNYNQAVADGKTGDDLKPYEEAKTTADTNKTNAYTAWQNCGVSKEQYDSSVSILEEFSGKNPDAEFTQVKIPPPIEFYVWEDVYFEKIDGDEGSEGQKQTITGNAARWWNHTTIHWCEETDLSGQLKIIKKIEGGEVAEAAADGKTFNFLVTIGGKSEIYSITYKKGGDNTVVTKPVTWELAQKLEKKTAELSISENSEQLKAIGENLQVVGSAPEEGTTPPDQSGGDHTTQPPPSGGGSSGQGGGSHERIPPPSYPEPPEEFIPRTEENAPDYIIKEITIVGGDFELVSIENGSGKLVANKTIEVTVTNKPSDEHLGDLTIIKEVDDTNLDTNQYSLVGQKFKFDVTIYGPCEFTYAGQTYKLGSKEDSQTITAEVTAVSKNDENKDKNAWKLADVKWYSDQTPTWEIKESTDGQPEGSEEVKLSASKGVFVDRKISESKVIAENKYEIDKEEKAKIHILKKVESAIAEEKDNLKEFSEKELDQFKFYFKVNLYSKEDFSEDGKLQSPSGEKYEEVILTATRKANNEWEAETNEYRWAYGNNPYYTVEELNICPMHGYDCVDAPNTPFNEAKCKYYKILETVAFNKDETITQNSNIGHTIEVTDKTIKGHLENETIEDGKFNCIAINTYPTTAPNKGKIVINKTIESNDNKGIIALRKDYNFIVKISGTFQYRGQNFKDQTIQLTNSKTEGYNLLSEQEEYNDNEFITINISEEDNSKKYTSDEFTWYGEAPTYEVYEYTEGNNTVEVDGVIYEIETSGVPQKGNLEENGIEGDAYKEIEVKAVNKISLTDEAYHSGYIKLIKKIDSEIAKKLGIDYLKQQRFRFQITVKDENKEVYNRNIELGDENYPLQYEDETGEYYWEYESPSISCLIDESYKNNSKFTVDHLLPLKYEITELDSASNLVLSSIEGEKDQTVEIKEVEGNTVISGYLQDSCKGIKDSEEDNDDKGEAKEFEIDTTDITAINNINNGPKTGKLKIEKQLTEASEKRRTFNFTVKLKGKYEYNKQSVENNELNLNVEIAVEAGAKKAEWISDELEWYGEAPTYEVIENKAEDEETEEVTIQNSHGVISSDGNTTTVVAINNGTNIPEDVSGRLKITKELNDKEKNAVITKGSEGLENTEYQFLVKITEYADGEKISDTSSFVVKIKAGETWESKRYIWKKGEKAPTYEVQEINIPETSQFDSIAIFKNEDEDKDGTVDQNKHSATGSLIEDKNIDITVKATNKEKEKKRKVYS